MRYLAILLLLAGLLAGCSGSDPGTQPVELPKRDPYVVGVITQIEGGRILVESDPGRQEGNKCWFAVEKTTLVVLQEKDSLTKVSSAALKTGQTVKAWERGPILESYPCQTGGEAILVTGTVGP
ncbi:MAG: DUF3221 domain-containing protein [Bacillota bacterium]